MRGAISTDERKGVEIVGGEYDDGVKNREFEFC